MTTDGNVWALATPTSDPATWKTQAGGAGTVSQILPGDTSLWVGGSNGRLYQLNLTTGVAGRLVLRLVGGGTCAWARSRTETGSELYVTTSDADAPLQDHPDRRGNLP